MRFLLFVLFLVFVLLFAHWSDRPARERMSTALAQAVSEALELGSDGVPQDPRFRDVRYEISNLDVILTGRVAQEETRNALVERIRGNLPFGRVRDERVQLVLAREPVLEARLEGEKVTLAGRVPSEDLAGSIRAVFQQLGVFVSAADLEVDRSVNLEPWLEQLDDFLARFFEGADAGEFVLRKGVLRLKRGIEKPVEREFIQAEVREWLPEDRYRLVDEMFVEEVVPPVELTVRRAGGRWILAGRVPDQPALDSLVQALENADATAAVDAGEVTVDERLTRPDWLQDGGAERFLRIFARTVPDSPQLTIRPDEVIMRGGARNFIAKSNLPGQAKEAFGYGTEVNIEGVRLMEEAGIGGESWLRFDLHPDKVVITGTVPSERIRNQLGNQLTRAYPEAELRDDGVVVDSELADMPWLSRLGRFFVDLAELTTQGGTIDLAGKEAFVGGIARSEWSRNALVGRLEQVLGPDFLVYDQLLVDPRGGDASEDAIKVYFGLGSRTIGPDQEEKIAEAARRIEESKESNGVLVLIKGYASPDGSTEYNIRLSQDRAVAVHEALVNRGVDPAGLKILNEGVDPELSGREARRVEIFIR